MSSHDPNVQRKSVFLLTIDVEDWFQVENFKQCVPFSSWPACELRVEKNTHDLLDLFDAISVKRSSQPRNRTDPIGPTGHLNSTNPRATFFVLGWIAERIPGLVREIAARGHEVASHGYLHELCNGQSSEALKQDLINSKKLIEDTIGGPVYGYRAPSFSISEDILKIIQDSAYLYDSSYNSLGLNKRYGKLDLLCSGLDQIAIPINPTGSIDQKVPIDSKTQFYELPISNLNVGSPFNYSQSAISSRKSSGGLILPWGGGGYFRLIPFFLFKIGVESILRKDGAYLFYMHPWEIDPGQPKVGEASWIHKFRHYTNLGSTRKKLSRLIAEFNDCEFLTCTQYLGKVTQNEAILDGAPRL